jgi:hypothetical protein
VATKNITNIMNLRNHGWFRNCSCPFVTSIGRKRPPIFNKNIAPAMAYGDDAIFVIYASNGPEGGAICGGGPAKLI